MVRISWDWHNCYLGRDTLSSVPFVPSCGSRFTLTLGLEAATATLVTNARPSKSIPRGDKSSPRVKESSSARFVAQALCAADCICPSANANASFIALPQGTPFHVPSSERAVSGVHVWGRPMAGPTRHLYAVSLKTSQNRVYYNPSNQVYIY